MKRTPQDLVGHKIPTPEEMKEFRDKLQSVTSFARALGPALSSEERKSAVKPRKGSEPHVKHVLELAKTHSLSSRNYSIEGVAQDLALFESIELAVKDAFVAWSALRDVYLQARSEYWSGFLHFHGALSHLAASDSEIAAEIKPIVEFMSLRAAPQEDPQPNNDGLE